MCAVSNTAQAHFGEGTKLTVLELDHTKEPDVEILKPSEIETGCKKRVTLVCVAKDFYPDHVSIRWSLGNNELKKDIATDPYAIKDKDTGLFSISSRLQVSKKDFKPKHNYTCTVKYYYETDKYMNVSSSIIGIEGDEYEPESYVNSAQWMKLAYGVFIAKSGLYGLVVLVYVMRKGSAGK
ncbi:T-cell receptor beta-1 chain C region isoform X2 [Carassius auratus]|uniref:T-cell receptor beta-1 chain C region isoform X2 n=1 Tax=Carassius auratus TaxID=7957 RepID=UPI003D92E95B